MDTITLSAVLLAALALGLACALAFHLGQWSGEQAAGQELRMARTMQDVAAAMAARHDLREALGVILERTARGLEATRGSLSLSEGGGDLRLVHAVGVENITGLRRVGPGDSLVGRLTIEGETVFIGAAEPGSAWASLVGDAPKSTLVITSFGVRPGRYGVLALAWRSRRQAQAAAGAVLGTAQYAGQALANFEPLERRGQEFQLLLEGLHHLETITATLAHDMGNTLTSLGVLLGLQAEEGAPEERQPAQEMLGHLDVVKSLRDDLMSLGRQKPFEPGRVPVRNLLELLPGMMARRMTRAQMALALQVPDDLPDMWGERIGLLRVLNNLIQNAVRYNHPGGRVWVKARHVGGWIEWEVGDTGIGIAVEALPHLFEFGYRVPGHERRSKKSHRIGLWSCRQIVEAHGGQIWATSVLEEGSRFHFTVPVALADRCRGTVDESPATRHSLLLVRYHDEPCAVA